MSQNDLKI